MREKWLQHIFFIPGSIKWKDNVQEVVYYDYPSKMKTNINM